MAVTLFLKFSLLLMIVSKSNPMGIALRDPDGGSPVEQEERDALDALKAAFNHPYLNSNWTGFLCSNSSSWYGIRCANGRVDGIFLASMGLVGTLQRDAFEAFTELTFLSLRKNLVSGIVMDFSSNQKLTVLDLSENRFDGRIPESLLFLSFLEVLRLQYNNLTFLIPEFNQTSLTFFNVSYNNLQGEIPKTRTLQSFRYDSFLNNPGLCGPPTMNVCHTSTNDGSPPSKPSSGSRFSIMFWLFDIAGLVAVVLLCHWYFQKVKKRKEMSKKEEVDEKGHKEKEQNDAKEKTTVSTEPGISYAANIVVEKKGKLMFLDEEPIFELNDLFKASAQRLGKGIIGNSYKAAIEGRATVVVKRLRDLKPLTNEEFTRQLYTIADQKHPNLLPLLAYYCSKDVKLIVHKYAAKGNLFNRIHGGRGKDRIPFRWRARLSVARGVARALEYLHLSDKSQSIIPHGNLKSSNVLLDENDTVLVSDYGLTSLIALPVAPRRMVAYKSPEYLIAKKVSKKSDVWSYGCLLLELLTAKVPAHSAPPGTNGIADLCSWVHRAVSEEWTNEIFDVEVSAQGNAATGMLRLLQIAIHCCDKSPEKRPEITELVRDVEKIKVAEMEDDDDSSVDQSQTDDSLSTSNLRDTC